MERNSMILPGFDHQSDLDAIRNGEGWFDPATRQIWVNGHMYGQHDDGQLYPMSGDNVVEWDRGTTSAFKVLRQYNGVTEKALNQIDRAPHISDDQRDEAIRVWRLREQAKRSQP